ncbi:MAG: PQQ-dependent sugar dehydrogenase, partial [Candidatus Thorarchaeota archaeon]
MKLRQLLPFISLLALGFGLLLGIVWWESTFERDSQEFSYILVDAFPQLTFNRPIGFYNDGINNSRLYVIEQSGRILSFYNHPNVTQYNVFLDIKDKVVYSGEQGLLGLAFHPNYSENGLFYLNYIADNPRRTVISQFSVNGSVADPLSEAIILEVNQPYANHNGGQLAFGPSDRFLYISLGDGGSGGDPLGHGQNRLTLLGSIIRIDVDQKDPGFNYAIPETNPFFNNSHGFREEIYAWGLRNPWRFSFDIKDHTLWAADVGQNTLEEINIIEKG